MTTQNQAGVSSQEIALARQFALDVRWFYFIAVLSVVNVLIVMTNGRVHFLIGLGVTEIIAGIARGLHMGRAGLAIPLALNLFIAGLLILFGVLARKRMLWALVLGACLYAGDGFIVLRYGDWPSAGFHAFALFFLYRGFKSGTQLNSIVAQRERQAQVAPPSPAAAGPVDKAI